MPEMRHCLELRNLGQLAGLTVSFYAGLCCCVQLCVASIGSSLRNLGHIRSADVSSYADSEIVLGAVAPGGTAAPNDGYK